MGKQLTFLAKSASFEKCTRDKKRACEEKPEIMEFAPFRSEVSRNQGQAPEFFPLPSSRLFDGKITWKIKERSMASEITFFYLLSYDMSFLRA